jgi:hypothetical protein
VDDSQTNPDDQTNAPLALVYTDAHGRVISLHGPLLDLMRLDDPLSLIGKPLHTVLGVDAEFVQELIDSTVLRGGVSDWPLEIYPQPGESMAVQWASAASRDDKGAFIGADITLRDRQAQPASHNDALTIHIHQTQFKAGSGEDQDLLRLYAAVQFSTLHVLLARLAGLRVAESLETTINKIAAKKDWPLSVSGDHLSAQQDHIPGEIYRALLSETIRFVASIIGRRMVVAQMRTVDEHMSDGAVQLAQESGLRRLFQDGG